MKETSIRPGTPMDISKADFDALVVLHEEQRRLKALFDEVRASATILCHVRSGMESVLGVDHEWNLDEDYDPENTIHEDRKLEKQRRSSEDGDNMMRRLFGV